MPSSHPIPSVASLTLSFMLTVKKVDRMAREVTVLPTERACFVVTFDNGFPEGI